MNTISLLSANKNNFNDHTSPLVNPKDILFKVDFRNGELRSKNSSEVLVDGVTTSEEGVVLAEPGKSFVEVHFNVDAQSIPNKQAIWIFGHPNKAVSVTLNGQELDYSRYGGADSSGVRCDDRTRIASLLQPGENVIRISLLDTAEDPFTVSYIGMGRTPSGMMVDRQYTQFDA